MLVNEVWIEDRNYIHYTFLKGLCNKKNTTKIYLRNGICLQGLIEGFDQAVIILKDKQR